MQQHESRKIQLGLAQVLVEGGEVERNLGRACELVQQAKQAGCDIVLLPEAIDFAWTHPRGLTDSQPIPGDFSQRFSRLAKQLKIHICVGLTENHCDNRDKKNYNTAVFFDDAGELLCKYRKINLLEVEFPFYQVGQHLSVVDTRFGKIGINICSDNYIDSLDLGNSLARMGAQVILSPSSWTVDHGVTEDDDPYFEKWRRPFQILARSHNIPIAATTSVGYIVGGPYQGKKMIGKSLVVDSRGVAQEAGFNEFACELLVTEIELKPIPRRGTQIGTHLSNFMENTCRKS